MFDLKSLKINCLVLKIRDFFISSLEILKLKAVKVLISGIPNQKPIYHERSTTYSLQC
jgi:hypothetical protein